VLLVRLRGGGFGCAPPPQVGDTGAAKVASKESAKRMVSPLIPPAFANLLTITTASVIANFNHKDVHSFKTNNSVGIAACQVHFERHLFYLEIHCSDVINYAGSIMTDLNDTRRSVWVNRTQLILSLLAWHAHPFSCGHICSMDPQEDVASSKAGARPSGLTYPAFPSLTDKLRRGTG
jgi:hypothetical protein